MDTIYDLIIIGAGPAGITAAVYAARKMMNFLVISIDIGGQTAWSGDIENYTGYQFVSGPELVEKFEDHMNHYKVNSKLYEEVVEVKKQGSLIVVTTTKQEYTAKSLIIASGKKSRELNIPGEKEYKNKGLTYCATCDGPLFKDKDVAVIGGGNSALDAVLQMMKIARHTHVININDDLSGDSIMKEKVTNASNVTVHNTTRTLEVQGEQFVSGLRVYEQGNESVIAVQGIFVEIGLVPNTDFIQTIGKNSLGEIQVDSHNRTSVEGIFAAGDVTDVPEKQIIIAAGDGSKALLGAFRYLSQQR